MDLATFSADNGYVEAKLRGYRSTFLREEHYNHMKNLNTLEELFQYLSTETDYGEYIDSNNVSINSLKTAMKKKLSDELDFIEINCTEDLSKFIFYIRAAHMIDNVMNIMEGLKAGITFQRLLASVDPIGYFPELKQTEIGASDIASLYEYVLIDSPVNEFFSIYLDNLNANRDMKNFNEVQTFFKEERPEKVRSMLKKIHLEKFYEYCQGLNTISRENMEKLLVLEADFKTLQVVYNSLEENKDERLMVRQKLCPAVGNFYPLHFHLLKNVDSLESLKEVMKGFLVYRRMLAEVQEPGNSAMGKTLEDLMYEEEVRALTLTFDEQANLSVFYSYVKLKEQEIRNIVWYAEMISRKLDKGNPSWKKIIVPFANE